MSNPKPAPEARFAKTLRAVRAIRGLSQEQFDAVSGRTYLSALERGLKIPTIGKVEDLARVLDVHPLTLLALCYCPELTEVHFQALWNSIATEGTELLVQHNSLSQGGRSAEVSGR